MKSQKRDVEGNKSDCVVSDLCDNCESCAVLNVDMTTLQK
jgi:hypothetical protein